MHITCPKCGHGQVLEQLTALDQCLKCGVFYEKAIEATQRGTSPAASLASGQGRSTGIGSGLLIILLTCVLIAGAWHFALRKPPPPRLPDGSIDPKIVMYSATYCGNCTTARAYFEQRGLPVTEYLIDQDADAKQRFKAYGVRGVPLILRYGRQIVGFSPDHFEAHLGQP